MTRSLGIAVLLCLLANLAVAAHAAPYCQVTASRVVLGNAQIRRVWVRRGPVWTTSRLSRADGSVAIALSPSEGFAVKVYQGPTIAGSACIWSPPQTRADSRGASVTFAANDPASGLGVAVRHWLLGDQPFMRTQVTVLHPADTIIDEIEVEHLAAAVPATRGGYGQPIFLGSAWYTGLEYPAGYNDLRDLPSGRALVLHHYPGRAVGQGLASKTAVVGVAPRGLTRELAFSDYLNTVRIQTRNFLQYNSWYDLQGGDLTIPNVLDAYRKFKANLLDPYGVRMDAFVPDDGWQNHDSIWTPDAARFPQGFRPLSAELEREGSHLGLWMPLNGTNLNTAWGAAQGYEVSDQGDYYCLVGPKYNAEIRRVTEQRIRDGNLAYYKHDFNGLQCSAPGHGHLPDARHGHEASLDAEIAVLAWERQVNPRIFLNVTSSVWLSPWWLLYADSIWMCAGDNGYEKTYPQLAPREWDMSYRDQHFYQVYRQQGNLVPLSALMTHGIIHGRLCKLGGDQETLREFSDMVVLYYARGVQLKELYITPDMMDEPRWRVVGEATRWAVDNAADLRDTVMIGGDPRRGQPYGYVHWNGDHGTIALRNPAPGAATIRVPFDQSVFYRGGMGRTFAARIIYPYHDTGAAAWTSGRSREWLVPGCSVMLLNVRPGRPTVGPAPPGAAPPLVAEPQIETHRAAADWSADLSFTLPAEQMPRCDLYLILRSSGQADLGRVTVNGATGKARLADGPGWRLQALDLRPLAGQRVAATVQLPGAGDRPFSAGRVRFEAWVVADRPQAESPRPAGLHTPWPIAQGYRRDSARVADTVIERRQATEHLTDDDLAHLRDGKLRLEVFDVNGEPPYGDKWVLLNCERLARVPANRGELSAWAERFLDLKPEQLVRLGRANTVVLTNAGGDCYKFRGVALSLQKPDGKWVETPADEGTYSSVGGWLYTEGALFRGDRSPEITVTVP
jgi:hypothetical protein